MSDRKPGRGVPDPEQTNPRQSPGPAQPRTTGSVGSADPASTAGTPPTDTSTRMTPVTPQKRTSGSAQASAPRTPARGTPRQSDEAGKSGSASSSRRPAGEPSPAEQTQKVAPVPAAPAATSAATAPGSTEGKPTDQPAKPSMVDRMKKRVSAAGDEHRANAEPASPQAHQAAVEATGRSPRRARLRLTRLDPWSVMKTAFLLSIAAGVVTIISVLVVWLVLGLAGVWDSINSMVGNVIGGESASGFDVTDYLGLGRVLGFTMLVSVINVVLLTAMATLMAFLYNMAAALLGGIEVTLAEDNDGA